MGRLGRGSRAFGMHGGEFLRAALGQYADEIDRRLRAAQSGGHRLRVAQIGLHGDNLSRPAERLKMEGEVGPPAGDAHPPAVAGERAHHMAPEETRAAEHRHQTSRLHAIRAHHPPRCIQTPPAAPASRFHKPI